MSTSRAYLAKRLKAIGRDDLLAAAERGEVTLHSAALWAGLITQQRVPEGNGSQNVSKRKAWALMRAERQGSLLGPKPEPQLAPENRPAPSAPKFSQETRDTIARLVDLGRADLVIAVTERRISPFQAARIADRGERTESQKQPSNRSLKRGTISEGEQKARQAELEAKKPPRPDVRALIG